MVWISGVWHANKINLRYALEITTKKETVIVDVIRIYFNSGMSVLEGESHSTKRPRKFYACDIINVRDIQTGETSTNAQLFLQTVGKRLS